MDWRTLAVDKHSPIPLYFQLAELIRERIKVGALLRESKVCGAGSLVAGAARWPEGRRRYHVMTTSFARIAAVTVMSANNR